MKKPLIWIVLLFSAGILVAEWIKIPLVWLYWSAGTILLALIFFLKRKFLTKLLLSLLVLIWGMIWLNNYRTVPECHIRKFYYQSQKVYALRGWVNSRPEVKENKTSFLFRIEEIADEQRKQICCGEILVMVNGLLPVDYGEELIMECSLHRPFGEYWRRQGIYRVARVKSPDFVRSTGKNKAWPMKRLLFRVKSRIENGFEKNLSPICSGVIEAMTIGEERNVPVKVYKDMVRSGTVHILVVSGSNVGVVGFIIVLLLKIFRVKRKIRFFCCVPLLLAYCFLTGASNPVVRATVMAGVFLFAYFVKRQSNIYNSCAAAALVILILDPGQIRDIGFQLSFASVLAIAYFYPRLKNFLMVDKLKSGILRLPIESCLVSFSAWLGTAGLIALYFRMVSPITVLANLLIVPLASIITLSGFSLLVAQSLSSYPALSFASVNELLVSLLLSLNSLLLQVPHAYFYF
ncbi:MAG: ComEC/Rec2 family competence protein [Candidatus Omnitrophica bacterium]|nr:ComEC/Rec2 family competence protein [Candidatus Omnitrophota bacterium]